MLRRTLVAALAAVCFGLFASAQAADGASGHFQHPDSMPIHSHFRVNGTMSQTQCPHRRLSRTNDFALCLSLLARGRHINGFLKVGAVQWIGLVKYRQHTQAVACQNALQREFVAWNEIFHLNELVVSLV